MDDDNKEQSGGTTALTEEILGWNEVSGKSGRVWNKLFARAESIRAQGVDSLALPRAQLVPSGDFWGWMTGGDHEKGTGIWQLHINEVQGFGGKPVGPAWRQAKLPQAWNGRLAMMAADGDQGELVLVGSAPGITWRNVWLVATKPGEAPDWPRLRMGTPGWGPQEKMQVLGILRKPWLGDVSNTKVEGLALERTLAVAWGYAAGEFLGWEMIESLADIKGMEKGEVHHFGPLEGWDRFEKELRHKSLGKEL